MVWRRTVDGVAWLLVGGSWRWTQSEPSILTKGSDGRKHTAVSAYTRAPECQCDANSISIVLSQVERVRRTPSIHQWGRWSCAVKVLWLVRCRLLLQRSSRKQNASRRLLGRNASAPPFLPLAFSHLSACSQPARQTASCLFVFTTRHFFNGEMCLVPWSFASLSPIQS